MASEWNQGSWITQTSCGTAACLAGWVVLLNGWEPKGFGETSFVSHSEEPVFDVEELPPFYQEGEPYQRTVGVFHSTNTIEDLRYMVKILEEENGS